MSFLEPGELLKRLVHSADEQRRLAAGAQELSRYSLADDIRHAGIQDLGELTPEQALCFVAARNLQPCISLLGLPFNPRVLEDQSTAQSYDVYRPKTTIGPALKEFMAKFPGDDSEFAVLHDPEDIPEAVPEDLLLRRHAPKEFLRRMTEGELIKNSWIHQEVEEELTGTGAGEEPDLSIVESDGDGIAPFHGYLLLDASESMGTGRDPRGIVARGLALAYLKSQYIRGNPTVLYLFRQTLSNAFGGVDRAGYSDAVSVVLKHSHDGLTNLQDNLGALAAIYSMGSERTDIALITDGITRLTKNPLSGAHLHTFLLGEKPEEFDKFTAAQYADSKKLLREWSAFFYTIEPGALREAIAPHAHDVLSLIPAAERAIDELESVVSRKYTAQLLRRLKIVHTLIQEMEKVYGKSIDPKIDQLKERIAPYLQSQRVEELKQQADEHMRDMSTLDRETMMALEKRQTQSILTSGPIGFTPKRTETVRSEISPWQAFLLFLMTMVQTLSRKKLPSQRIK